MKSIFYAYLIIVLVLSGCSSGKSTFERGNYYEAVLTSVNRLRRNSDHKKSVETLRQAYPMAVAFYEDRAKTSLASSERFKWSEVVKSYTAINVMYDEIKRCPGCMAVIPNPVNYLSKLQEARQNAAEENYAAGILALQTATRESAKQAYGYFKIANDYVPGYKEVKDYLDAALMAATVKIVVEPIPVHSKSVGVSAEFFNDKVSEFVHNAAISEFVRFYTRAEAQKIKLNPDHIVQLEFDDFTVGEVYKHEREIHLTKDSVVMGTYVSASTTASQGNNQSDQVTNGRTALTTTGTPVVVARQNPTSNNNTVTSPANNTHGQTASEAAQLQAERERAQREAAERERIARENAEKERIARESAEKERIERERAEAEIAAKQAAEKAAAEKALADKTLAEKTKMEREQAEKERIERERVEKERAEKERIERERIEKERAEKELAESVKAEREKAEREQADKAAAEKAKAAKEKADKEKADRERAEKEKAEKGKAEKVTYVDPTINSADTLNVTDGVLICHIPPGNTVNARSLRINRSALKAHLAHGDVEGGCEKEQQKEKGKPEGNEKLKPQEEIKPKPQPDSKGKGNKGTGKIDAGNGGSSPLFDADAVLIASRDNGTDAMFRYMQVDQVAVDTNKVYGTVKATLYHYTKTTTSKGIVSFRIIDAKTGALLSVQKMPGEFVWKSEWATFNGDERALSAEQLQLTRQKEQPAPKPQDLFIEFTRPIYDQITTKLKEFYKAY